MVGFTSTSYSDVYGCYLFKITSVTPLIVQLWTKVGINGVVVGWYRRLLTSFKSCFLEIMCIDL